MIFERTVAQWLTSLRKDGFTALMIDELNKHTANIKYWRLLNLDIARIIAGALQLPHAILCV